MEHLLEMLQKNTSADIYPYHMPGHKRRGWGEFPDSLFELDITEIDGFDNLHQPEGVLLELQKKASRLYGAEESFYLVNGSTCGILGAVSCVLPPRGHVLMARNCHRSVYHAAYLEKLSISYLYPPYLEDYDIFDAITPQQVLEALEQEPDIGAVVVVSPTYEGRIADIGAIAEIVHKKGIPLIVDEAHGAHLGLAPDFPENSCQLGADLVIHSVHKTLPSLTQTALLHVNGPLVDRERLKRFLHIYQSSSPSYVLMASIDNALRYVETEGQEAFQRFRVLYGNMRKALTCCRHLNFLPVAADFSSPGKMSISENSALARERTSQDIGKLFISVKGTELTGKELYDILLQKYHLQLEMASESFVLAMFTVNDGVEAYCRMTEALLEIDQALEEKPETLIDTPGKKKFEKQKLQNRKFHWSRIQADSMPLSTAWDMDSEWVTLEKGIGRHVGEFINLYPPGVPLLVPGERMTEVLCECIRSYMEQGLTVQGICMLQGKACLKVIC